MTRYLIYSSLLCMMLYVGCKKDELDFNKFNNLTLTQEFGIPVAVIDLSMNKLLSPDSNIIFGPDGLISFVYRQDNIADFPADSFVHLPEQSEANTTTNLGTVDIADYTIENYKTLGGLSGNFNPATKAALDVVSGQISIFPAINDVNNEVSELSFGSNFESVNLSNGFLVVGMKNGLPVTIDKVKLYIYNMIPFQSLMGIVTFSNVAPFSSAKDSINLAGTTLSSTLGYTMPQFKSFASQSPVLINMNDSISFKMETRGLRATGGRAVIPSQTFNTGNLQVDLDVEDPETRLRKLEFGTGRIKYTLTSTVKELIELKLSFPNAMKNGTPFAPVTLSANNNTKTGYIDIGNVRFDLSTDINKPYNRIIVNVNPEVISSNQIKPFDSADHVTVKFEFEKLEYAYMDGYMGAKNLTIGAGSIDADFSKGIGSGLKFDDPRLRIITSNSIGLPISVNLNLTAISADGLKTQPLDGVPFVIPYPTIAQAGTTVNNTFTYDKSNSKIVEVVGLPPAKMNFGGAANANPGGFTGYTNFIDKKGRIKVGFEMDMPLSLKTNELVMQDTTSSPLPKNEKKITKVERDKDSLKYEKDYPNNVDYVDLVLKVDNGFPFDGSINLYFVDTMNWSIIDSVSGPSLMASAVPDALGRIVQRTVKVSSLRMEQKQLANIYYNPRVRMIFKAGLSTYASGTQAVKIYSDYNAKIGISIKFKLKQKI